MKRIAALAGLAVVFSGIGQAQTTIDFESSVTDDPPGYTARENVGA